VLGQEPARRLRREGALTDTFTACLDPVLRRARRVAIAVIGSTVLLVGAAMIILPGPAVIVIPVGLAILATEFVWARRLLERVRARLRRAAAPDAPDGSRRDSKER
jgi:uncharacterized protein (TIGR02611 family)